MDWVKIHNRGNDRIMELVKEYARKNGLDFNDHFRELTEMSKWGRIFPKTLYFGSTDGYADDANLNRLAEKTGISVDFWKNALFYPEEVTDLPEDFPTE